MRDAGRRNGLKALMAWARPARWLLVATMLAAASLPARAQHRTAVRLAAEADSLLAADALDAAEERYRAALRADDAFVPALLGLGRIGLLRRKWDDAGTWADRALDRAPDNLEAHYVRGVSNREIARYRTLFQRRHWEGAEKHFEAILRQDSLYRDVLYQYARLRSHHGAFDEAIRLGQAQLRLNPDVDDARLGLFKIYREFVHTRPDAATTFLEGRSTAFDRFFLAERHRLGGRPGAAEALLAGLASAHGLLPASAVSLARARLQYEQDAAVRGQALVDRAIDEIDGPVAARFVLEDFKYLILEDEWETFQTLEEPEALRAFFRRFWARRDPMPSLGLNVRIQEHYARLRHAERDFQSFDFKTWFNNPDKLSELPFPETYALNEEFNDRGLIFIRHGAPGDRIVQVSEASSPNDSWRYYQPEMDFHFVIAEGGSGSNWRLTPRLAPGAMTESRTIWGNPYLLAAQADSQLDLLEADHRITEHSKESLTLGLTTESYHWPEAVERFDVPHLLAAFRAPDGRVRVEAHYAVPDEALEAGAAAGPGRVEAGFSLVDPDWRRVAEARRVHDPGAAGPGATVGYFEAVVAPDTYQVALHLRTLGQPAALGIVTRDDYHPPAFPDDALSMSDLLPARLIRAADRGDTLVRNDLYVQPNPSGTFPVQSPVYVYYELYGLTPGADGLARFTVELALVPERERRGLLSLFRRKARPVLRVSTERAGPGGMSAEHAEIDVRAVDPGPYRLRVTVTDSETGRGVERSTALVLVE